MRRHAITKNKYSLYTINDICNSFSYISDQHYYDIFGTAKTKLKECSPGCIDYYYDDLQYFNGDTSRPRERLFFSNYTHLANKLYPLPISLRTIYRPYIGFRTVAGDAREQATNFTHCPDFWNIYKVEAAVYPTDDVFNMCRDEAFYRQDPDESIDCAYTEKVGYSVITIGATLIVTMYIVAYLIIFIEKVKNIEIALSSKIRDEFKITAYTTRGFFLSTKVSIKVALTTAVSLSMPKMNN